MITKQVSTKAGNEPEPKSEIHVSWRQHVYKKFGSYSFLHQYKLLYVISNNIKVCVRNQCHGQRKTFTVQLSSRPGTKVGLNYSRRYLELLFFQFHVVFRKNYQDIVLRHHLWGYRPWEILDRRLLKIAIHDDDAANFLLLLTSVFINEKQDSIQKL